MSTVDKLANRLAAEQRCLCLTEGFCGEPATVHVLLGHGVPTMSCRQHAGWWATHPYEDLHPIGAACGLPGTSWMTSANAPPGRCFVDGLDPAHS